VGVSGQSGANLNGDASMPTRATSAERSEAGIVPLSLVVSAAATPILGIVIQGIHIMGALIYNRIFKHGGGPSAFFDPARVSIGRAVKESLSHDHDGILKSALEANERRKMIKKIKKAPNDSIFVWLYYSSANAHLIDWARRRRSYYYLGVNLALASFLGTLAGICIGYSSDLSHMVLVHIALSFVVLWFLCAIWLAACMKNDVDSMELVWAWAAFNPRFKSSFIPPALEGGAEKADVPPQ
jgi:hypothetical protein